MEMLQLVESIQAEQASVQKLFGGEGTSTHTLRETRGKTPEYLAKLAEAAKLVADVFEGRRGTYLLREAMGTGDFPYLFGDILDRQVLANYNETPQVWAAYAKRGVVPDFRSVNRFAITGSEAVLTAVPAQSEYPESSVSDVKYTYAVQKYGRRVPFSWESMINDDLDALKDIPARLGRAARRSEEKFATQLHVGPSGLNTNVYTAGNKNIINATNAGAGWSAVNPPLSIAALQQGMVVLANMLDADGEPIFVQAVTLEVPPGLEITARNILNQEQIWLDPNPSAGTAKQITIAQNWMRNRVNLSVNPYIPIVASTANGNTSWFLHADPNAGRPAFEMGFLRGHESPEIFIKAPTAQSISGGADPMNGDFDTDSVEYKIRHVFGGVALDPKMTVMSNGSGS